MKKMFILGAVIGVSLMLVFSACSKDAEQSSEGDEASAKAAEEKEVTFENPASIIGTNVNVRASASTDSAVVTTLNSGTTVGILDVQRSYSLVGKFYGRWTKIQMADGKTGHVLGCFLRRPGDDEEKFHIFFDRFHESLKKQDIEAVAKHVNFPIEYVSRFEADSSTTMLEKGDFFANFTIEEPHMYPMNFTLDDSGDILCNYGYEGSFYELAFRQVHGKWMMVSLRVTLG